MSKKLIYLDDALRAMPALEMCSRALMSLETVDARPITHGSWIKLGETDFQCSVCGFRFTSGDSIEMFPYCRCGASMTYDKE